MYPSPTGFVATAGKHADHIVVLYVTDISFARITHDEQKSVSRHTDRYERELTGQSMDLSIAVIENPGGGRVARTEPFGVIKHVKEHRATQTFGDDRNLVI